MNSDRYKIVFKLKDKDEDIITCKTIEEVKNTIWIQGTSGGTTLRIKCTGKIITDVCKNSPVSHADVIVQGDIDFCLSKDAEI